MAKNNAINNRSSELTVDPGATGDSFVQFDINTTNEYRVGVDDTDSDAFKVSQGGALGTNDHFAMSADGERTLPLNPCFYAVLGSDESNVTGSGTAHTLGTSTAFTSVYDQGSNLSSLNPVTFTAPITGRYALTVNCGFSGVDTATATSTRTVIVTSNRNHTIFTGYSPDVDSLGTNVSMVVDMDASDTATFTGTVFGQVGDTADIEGVAADGFTGVSGCLVS